MIKEDIILIYLPYDTNGSNWRSAISESEVEPLLLWLPVSSTKKKVSRG